jgi:hypothetical protein
MVSLVRLLVGLGQIGLGYDLALDPDRYIYTHSRALSRHPKFRLLVGVDPDAGFRRRAARHLPRGTRVAWDLID